MINGITSIEHSQGASRTAQQRINLPPFILSATKPKMSDEDYKQKIIEMAKRDYAAGRFQSKDPNGEFHALRYSYMSVVSPEREDMINNALPTILDKIREYTSSNKMITPTTYRELIMLLLFGESALSPNMDKGQQRVLFELYDANGNNIATLTTGGWHQYCTSAENARSAEFMTIYNDAWNYAKGADKWGWGETPLPDGWAMESESTIPVGTTPNMTANTITTVDVSELQSQQGQSALQATAARYEANLHEVS